MQNRRTKRQQAEATRALLMAAAADLFATGGYDGTTVDDICSAAGRARGAFYVHFRSRADIFLAVVEQDAGAHPLLLLDALAWTARTDGEGAALRRALEALVPHIGDREGLLALGTKLGRAPVKGLAAKAA